MQSRCILGGDRRGARTLLLADCEAAHGEIFNIGSDEEITIAQLAERVRIHVRQHVSIERVPYERVYGRSFEDMRRRVPDLSKIRRAMSYRPVGVSTTCSRASSATSASAWSARCGRCGRSRPRPDPVRRGAHSSGPARAVPARHGAHRRASARSRCPGGASVPAVVRPSQPTVQAPAAWRCSGSHATVRPAMYQYREGGHAGIMQRELDLEAARGRVRRHGADSGRQPDTSTDAGGGRVTTLAA